jgi:mRNA interferase HigB
MRIIKRKTLVDYYKKHADAEQPLELWYHDVKSVQWQNSSDIKKRYASASFLSGNRVVFNIKGNNLRIVVVVKYTIGFVYIRFIGTHAEYDKIDAGSI